MGAPYRFDLRELSGALGDLGTLLPLMLGAIAIAGLATSPILAGFGLFYISTALVYRLPIPVQPMKVVAALVLTGALAPNALVATGVLTGLILLVLGTTGLMSKIGRLVPQSVLAGLQLGLGLSLALVALNLMGQGPLFGAIVLLAALGLMSLRVPAVFLVILGAAVAGSLLGAPVLTMVGETSGGSGQVYQSVGLALLPQLALTLTNAVFLTAYVAKDYYGEDADHVTPNRLAVTTGAANLCLTPFGAFPMCHGAGGVAAHHRFGARTGGAPLALGVLLLALAAFPPELSFAALSSVPTPALGALLLIAAGELAFSRRLTDALPSCRPVIAVAALATVLFNPMWGLIAGTLAEVLRRWIVRRYRNA